MTYDVEHFFICLFAICISSLVRYPLWSWACFKIGLLIFLLLSFMGSLYMLDNNPLSDVSFASVFSQCVVCFLVLLILSLDEN